MIFSDHFETAPFIMESRLKQEGRLLTQAALLIQRIQIYRQEMPKRSWAE